MNNLELKLLRTSVYYARICFSPHTKQLQNCKQIPYMALDSSAVYAVHMYRLSSVWANNYAATLAEHPLFRVGRLIH